MMDTSVGSDAYVQDVEQSTSNARVMVDGANLILRQSRMFYIDMCAHLQERHGFLDLAVSETQTNVFRSKFTLLGEQFAGLGLILRNFRTVRRARVIYAVGFIALTAKLLRRLGLLRYERLFWYSFFIHSPSWLPLFRILGKLLDTDRETYVISSRGELSLYGRELQIPQHRMVFLPFGDWQSHHAPEKKAAGDYYFSGGYSNRDYPALAKAWQQLPDQRLVIVCSHLNTEMDQIDFPPNVEILRDLSLEEFESWISGAKACILPLKHNSGAAGQTVLFQYIRKHKLVIANGVDVVDDYLENGVNGVVVSDIATDLPDAIRKLEQSPDLIERYADAAYDFYKNNLSREVMQHRLTEIVTTPVKRA